METELEYKFTEALTSAEARLAEIDRQLKTVEVSFFKLDSERKQLLSTIESLTKFLKSQGKSETLAEIPVQNPDHIPFQ